MDRGIFHIARAEDAPGRDIAGLRCFLLNRAAQGARAMGQHLALQFIGHDMALQIGRKSPDFPRDRIDDLDRNPAQRRIGAADLDGRFQHGAPRR
jgi:hypothetical protein